MVRHSTPGRPVLDVRGGPGARVQLVALQALVLAAGPVGERGVHRIAWRLARLFDSGNTAVVETGFGRMLVPLADGYAVKLLARRYRYEPEIEPFIRGAMRCGCSFIDGGANLGYWSIFASSLSVAPHQVIAVEPVPALFDLLCDNAALNEGRFLCRRAALWSEPGAELAMVTHPQWHAGSSAVNLRDKAGDDGYYATTAPTTTVDDLADRYCADGRPVLLKLDVEGAERAALMGATETVARHDTILLYEDHGSDRAHRSTRYVLNELGFRVFACTGHGLEEVSTPSDVVCHKTDTVHGFNFLAFHPRSTIGPEVVRAR